MTDKSWRAEMPIPCTARSFSELSAVIREEDVEELVTRANAELNAAGPQNTGIDWVIVGGESGPGTRPCNVEWICSIVEQCKSAHVPVFVKQLGSDPIVEPGPISWPTSHPKGADQEEWPEDLRVREFPKVSRG